MKFGGLTAIDDLSFSANNNEITSIIGPNGAGKTTVFNITDVFPMIQPIRRLQFNPSSLSPQQENCDRMN